MNDYNNRNNNNSDLKQLTGLWKSQSKSGQFYLSGNIKSGSIPGLNKSIKILVFERKPKKDDDPNKNYPDFSMCYTEAPAGKGESYQTRADYDPPRYRDRERTQVDDVPF